MTKDHFIATVLILAGIGAGWVASRIYRAVRFAWQKLRSEDNVDWKELNIHKATKAN